MADLNFDDLIPAKSPKSGDALSFEDLIPVKSGSLADAASDVGRTVLPGLARGLAGTVALPNTGIKFAEDWIVNPIVDRAMQVAGLTPRSREGQSAISDGFLSQEQVLKPVEAVTGPLYHPKTVPGEIANTIAEFAPNALFGGGTALQRAGQVVVPALTSEGAGQAARQVAPNAEPFARLAGGVLGGLGTAVAQAPRGGSALMREGLQGVTPDELKAAQALREEARSLPGGGFDLPLDEAINRVTDGRATRLSQISRVVANSGGPGAEAMAARYAERPGQIASTGRSVFDQFGPLPAAPSGIGLDVQAAARAGVEQTPQGMALARAREAVGPRIGDEAAGQAIQRDLRATADRREAVRDGQAAQDYGAARAAPENAGIERTVTVERPGDPVVTRPAFSRPQFTDAAPRPLEAFSRPAADATGAGPESLARFIARNGGVRLDGEAAATDLHRFNIPGHGNVARADGKSIDNFWRERLIEEGYFRPDADGGMARDISSELLRKLQNEQRGMPSYPIGQERAAAADRARPSQMADEHAAAVSLAESRLNEDLSRFGVDPASVHPDIRDRVLGALVRGEHTDPLQAYERTVSAMKGPLEPYTRSTTVTEQVPDVRFGQVNPMPALDAISEQARTAKGDVRGALGNARRDLFEAGGEPDMSVAGLLHARERLDFAIRSAAKDGDGTKVRDLTASRDALDAQLKAVPEVATADRNFAANSAPLEPFTGNAPLARIVQRDPLSGRMGMPAEQVPPTLAGPTAARELRANASPAAVAAYDGRMATRIMDAATDARGNVSAEGLLKALREHGEALDQAPGVRDRLSAVVQARDAMAPVEASPLGQLAATPETRAAADTLFPRAPLAGSQGEIGDAMAAVARNNPTAAQQVARQHLEGQFNTATQDVSGVARQYGGAGFASRVRGTKQLRDNLDAAVGALPGGSDKVSMMDKFLTALEATGYRPQKGSDTAFNTEIRKLLANGAAPLPQAITDAAASAAVGAAAAGAGGAGAGTLLALRRGASEGLLRHRVNRSGEDIARLLFDRSVPTNDLLGLLTNGTRPDAQRFLARVLGLGAAGGTSGNLADRARRPVR